ncbi:hypothetical protein GY45DRAFT_911050 [Cubamyces sp. BRFM 1775]|nr:hypothetical protein GY45DRAFT_911050 [Cubamyces sp. BRFM 1775]
MRVGRLSDVDVGWARICRCVGMRVDPPSSREHQVAIRCVLTRLKLTYIRTGYGLRLPAAIKTQRNSSAHSSPNSAARFDPLEARACGRTARRCHRRTAREHFATLATGKRFTWPIWPPTYLLEPHALAAQPHSSRPNEPPSRDRLALHQHRCGTTRCHHPAQIRLARVQVARNASQTSTAVTARRKGRWDIGPGR